jgi:hypothetical protein
MGENRENREYFPAAAVFPVFPVFSGGVERHCDRRCIFDFWPGNACYRTA